jgi:hypothetical protein
MRAATVISLMSRLKIFPRAASAFPFDRLMVAHFECPDIVSSLSIFSFRSWSYVNNNKITSAGKNPAAG